MNLHSLVLSIGCTNWPASVEDWLTSHLRGFVRHLSDGHPGACDVSPLRVGSARMGLARRTEDNMEAVVAGVAAYAAGMWTRERGGDDGFCLGWS